MGTAVQVHHCMVDGVSGTDLSAWCSTRSRKSAGRAERLAAGARAVGPSADRGRRSGPRAAPTAAGAGAGRRRPAAGPAGPAPAPDRDRPAGAVHRCLARAAAPRWPDRYRRPAGSRSRARSVSDVAAVRHALGGTFNDVVLAARGRRLPGPAAQPRGTAAADLVRTLVPVYPGPRRGEHPGQPGVTDARDAAGRRGRPGRAARRRPGPDAPTQGATRGRGGAAVHRAGRRSSRSRWWPRRSGSPPICRSARSSRSPRTCRDRGPRCTGSAAAWSSITRTCRSPPPCGPGRDLHVLRPAHVRDHQREVPGAEGGPVQPARREPRRPPRQARVPLGVLEPAAARAADAGAGADVHGRQGPRAADDRSPPEGRPMPVTTISGHQVHVDPEGFLTEYAEWDDARPRAGRADRHRADRRALEGDPLPARGLRRPRRDRHDPAACSVVAGIPTKKLFELFPKKPAKKMAYVAGLPKPHGCV